MVAAFEFLHSGGPIVMSMVKSQPGGAWKGNRKEGAFQSDFPPFLLLGSGGGTGRVGRACG